MQIAHILIVLTLTTSLYSCSSKKTAVTPEGEKPQIVEVAPNYSYIYENLKHYTQNGISAEHRELAWRRLFESKTLDQKLFHAADYIDSFDFQAWNWGFSDSAIQEDAKLRDYVVAHDILELSLSLTELLSKLRPHHSEDVFTMDRNLQSFYAIAASLGDVVPPSIPNLVTHSLYESIQNGLEKNKELNENLIAREQLTRTENEVIKNAELFKDTFYARFQYLSYIATQIYQTEPEQALEAVNFALATRDFLKSIEVEVKLDKKVKKLLKQIKTPNETLNSHVHDLITEKLP